MYLLKLRLQSLTSLWSSFTFHYVSIKTRCLHRVCIPYTYLHSTMYLLKQECSIIGFSLLTFTFHYVSIKTPCCAICIVFFINLHSTMYLLKLMPPVVLTIIILNLHSTMYLLKPNIIFHTSTVSDIYIPLCIY